MRVEIVPNHDLDLSQRMDLDLNFDVGVAAPRLFQWSWEKGSHLKYEVTDFNRNLDNT